MTVTPNYARPAEGELRVGPIFSSSWDIFSANFVKFFIISAVVGLPDLLARLSVPLVPSVFGPPLPAEGYGAPVGAGTLVTTLLNMVAQAVIVYIAFQYLRGQEAPFGVALRKGLARFLPILGCVILLSLGIAIGFVLLIIPGVMLLVRWSVAVPACVLEGLGPVASLGRSAALTRGHRWKIFGILLLIWIASLIIGSLVGLLTRPMGTTANLFGNFLWTAVWASYYGNVLVMIYHDLRVAKEGVDVDQIAAVFD